ncbi:site-specific integrase [Rhodococcus sp. AQ5-07]|uniref:site-specific integrase n=1 Tax=Rhodococcus sp. AQ5-07 TaxID=2054902 RepID=UPI000DC00222|nr:tyrosine-type recombinase/integrase [Rhodococcus sp. AQ5-07]RAL31169.1 site-specific integrase [Rhodococcus sp. AQ5-07]
MAGRPPLDIGAHGTITRVDKGRGVWLARCRYRAADGRTRIVERRSPSGRPDRYGAAAEAVLLAVIAELQTTTGEAEGATTGNTRLTELTERWLTDLKSRSESVRTTDTYSSIITKLDTRAGGLLVKECTPRRLDRLLVELAEVHGPTTARQAKTVLSGVFTLAIRDGAVSRNPVKDVGPVRVPSKTAESPDKGRALMPEELTALLHGLGTSELPLPPEGRGKKKVTTKTTRTVSQWAKDVDLIDPITMLAGTGLRRSEMLGLRWADYDAEAGTIAVTGRVVRGKGVGLIREDVTKTTTSRRVVALPLFAVEMLTRRADGFHPSEDGLIFPSSAGTLRDPDNLNGQFARVRGVLGFEWVATHTFRRTVATLADEAGLSARVGADHLGHARVSMTQDVYMARGKTHSALADVLDIAVRPKAS